MQLDEVHRRHREAGAVHHAGDVAVERDIVQVVLARRRAPSRLPASGRAAPRASFWRNSALSSMLILASSATRSPSSVTMSGLTSTRLASLSMYSGTAPARSAANCAICLPSRPRPNASSRHWYACRPAAGMDVHAEDLLRRVRGDFLDVHAAGGRGDEGDAALLAVEHEAQVDLARDLRARLDVDLVDRQAFGARLLRDQALCRACRPRPRARHRDPSRA